MTPWPTPLESSRRAASWARNPKSMCSTNSASSAASTNLFCEAAHCWYSLLYRLNGFPVRGSTGAPTAYSSAVVVAPVEDPQQSGAIQLVVVPCQRRGQPTPPFVEKEGVFAEIAELIAVQVISGMCAIFLFRFLSKEAKVLDWIVSVPARPKQSENHVCTS